MPLKIIYPPDPGAGVAPVGTSFVAFGTSDTSSARKSRTRVAVDRTLQPLIFHRPGRWLAYFKHLRSGKCTLTATNGDNQGRSITRNLNIDHRIRGITNPIAIQGVALPAPNDHFCPDSFYAYGLLEEGDTYIVSAIMSAPTLADQPASFIFTDPDTGFWVAMFDTLPNVAQANDRYTLTVTPDDSNPYTVQNLEYDATIC